MNGGLAGSISTGGQLYVRALYDYEADDRTSLSFRQGDIIQVITQLESGWWDGVIHGVRGWFPSNYCAMVAAPSYDDGTARPGRSDSDAEESGGEYDDQTHFGPDTARPASDVATRSQEEAAFWIPQATPDGRLFYFNTLTGESTMELPLEAPTSSNETGPRDRTNIYIPDITRPPAEFLQSGYGGDDDTDYASQSEAEDASLTRGSNPSSVSCTPARAVHLLENECHLTNADYLSAATQTFIPVRRRVTRDVHGFAERDFAVEPLSHKSHRGKQRIDFGNAAGYGAGWCDHALVR